MSGVDSSSVGRRGERNTQSAGHNEQTSARRRHAKTRWTNEEDKRLLLTIRMQYNKLLPDSDAIDWKLIANKMPHRTFPQLRERYMHVLNPDIDRSHITNDQMSRLLRVQFNFGNQWKLISREFPGRTTLFLKNAYYSLVRRFKRWHDRKPQGAELVWFFEEELRGNVAAPPRRPSPIPPKDQPNELLFEANKKIKSDAIIKDTAQYASFAKVGSAEPVSDCPHNTSESHNNKSGAGSAGSEYCEFPGLLAYEEPDKFSHCNIFRSSKEEAGGSVAKSSLRSNTFSGHFLESPEQADAIAEMNFEPRLSDPTSHTCIPCSIVTQTKSKLNGEDMLSARLETDSVPPELPTTELDTISFSSIQSAPEQLPFNESLPSLYGLPDINAEGDDTQETSLIRSWEDELDCSLPKLHHLHQLGRNEDAEIAEDSSAECDWLD